MDNQSKEPNVVENGGPTQEKGGEEREATATQEPEHPESTDLQDTEAETGQPAGVENTQAANKARVEDHPDLGTPQPTDKDKDDDNATRHPATAVDVPEATPTTNAKNICNEVINDFNGLSKTPTGEDLNFLVGCIKDKDWGSDHSQKDTQEMLDAWKATLANWNLDEERKNTLVQAFGNCEDNKKTKRTALRSMKTLVTRETPQDPKTSVSWAETMNKDLTLIPNTHEHRGVQEGLIREMCKTWEAIDKIEPGARLRGQSTETAERISIKGDLERYTKKLRPLVNITIHPSFMSSFIIMATMLATAQGLLARPGDTQTELDTTARLHVDETGAMMLSLEWEEQTLDITYQTRVTNFEQISDLEEDVAALAKALGPGINNKDVKHPKEPIARRHCDCILETEYPTDKANNTWLVPHEEDQGHLCRTDGDPEQKYEVTVRITHQGPECAIRPTNKTRNKISGAYGGTGQELVKTLNHNRRHPCVTNGGYNLNKIPRTEIATRSVESLIECILHCMFRKACTNWMFHEKQGKCWLLSINRKYPFEEVHRNDTKIYTGERACTPCGLTADIKLPNNDRDMWEDKCALTLDPKRENPLKCPCDTEATYRNNAKYLSLLYNKTKENNIRRVPGITLQSAGDVVKNMFNLAGPTVFKQLRRTLQDRGNPMKGMDLLEWATTLAIDQPTKALLNKALSATAKLTPGNPTDIQDRTTTLTTPNRITDQAWKLLRGQLQTNSAIRKALENVDDAITSASTQKHMQSTGTEQRRPDDTMTTETGIMISLDWGDKITRTKLNPIRRANKTTQVTVCPIPTSITGDNKEAQTLEGNLLVPGQKSARVTKCAKEIQNGMAYLQNCSPGYPPRPRRPVWTSTIETKNNKATLARITTPGGPQTLWFDCTKSKNAILNKGVLIVIILPDCAIVAPKGNTIVAKGRHNRDSPKGYRILYNEEQTWEFTEDQWVDIYQSIILAAIMICIVVESARRVTKKCKRHTDTETHNPQRGSP